MAIDTDSDNGGASAHREYERRLARHERAIDERWGTGRLGQVVRALNPPPQSTVAWAKGSDGERRLAAHLARATSEDVVLLHDRKVPGKRSNIDHLAVTPSGIWVIDAKNYRGKVERRDVGNWRQIDDRLYVAGRDRTKLVRAMAGQADVVRSQLEAIGRADIDVHCALCFTDSEWGLLARPFRIEGVLVTYARKLADELSEPGPLDPADVHHVSAALNDRLRPA